MIEDHLDFLMTDSMDSQGESRTSSEMDVDSDVFNRIIERNGEETAREENEVR